MDRWTDGRVDGGWVDGWDGTWGVSFGNLWKRQNSRVKGEGYIGQVVSEPRSLILCYPTYRHVGGDRRVVVDAT